MRKKINVAIVIISLFAFIMIVGGVSYSYFTYNRNVADVALTTGEMNISFQNNNGNSYSSSNAIPMSDEMGIVSSSYLDFTINGVVDTEDIKYELEIVPKSDNTINTQYVKVYLTDQQDNVILSPYLYTELIDSEENSGKSLYQSIIKSTGVATNVSRAFRLRLWVDESYTDVASMSFAFDVYLYAYNVKRDDYVRVELYTNDGRSGLVKYALSGSTYNFLPTPIKEGSIFDGWSVESTDTIQGLSVYQAEHQGDYSFNGTSDNYNTEISLFSEENLKRNFYISFEIKNKSHLVAWGPLVSSHYDRNSKGFIFQVNGDKNGYALQTNNGVDHVDNAVSWTTSHVEILRINNKLYYIADGGDPVQVCDYSDFNSPFDTPLVFGADLIYTGIRKYSRLTLSNIFVTFLDSAATISNYADHYYTEKEVIISANWYQNIIFDQVTSKDIQNLSYIKNYNDDIVASGRVFSTQDTVGVNNKKKTVYYYSGADALEHGNVLFAGFCWQIIRTTDTGSVKMIYNGIAENDMCKTDRDYSATKGILKLGSTAKQTLTGNKIYGRSYDYDLSAGTFTIKDTTGLPSEWSESDTNNNGIADWQELVGMYTCLSDTLTTCTTLYYIGHYQNATQASTTRYKIDLIGHYSHIGTTQFQARATSVSLVGYMFNTTYNYLDDLKSGTYYADVSNYANGVYTLTGAGNTSPDNDHHYVCDDNDCTKVRFYYYVVDTIYRYILLENGETVESTLKKMVNSTGDPSVDINAYNSALKGYIDNWYAKNLINYTSYLDAETVYCDDRSVVQINGFAKNGNISAGTPISYYQHEKNKDLSCNNITDRFSVNNGKAKLTYPIGLMTEPERGLVETGYAATGKKYWMLSPIIHTKDNAYVRIADEDGTSKQGSMSDEYGVRPVISLKSDVTVLSGNGGYETPYVIDTFS